MTAYARRNSLPAPAGRDAVGRAWSVARRAHLLEVGYGSESDFPQYAALHTDSSYLRLNYGPESDWGSSLILLPSLWAGGLYHQGASVVATWRHEGEDLLIVFEGDIAGLRVRGRVQLSPPEPNAISARVSVQARGAVALDHRPGEAFKPVVLSSMHVSRDRWDAVSARIGARSVQIPASGWLIDPPVTDRLFGLKGGRSIWKSRAPTVEIELGRRLELTGWKTGSADPNDDNLSIWAASDRVLSFWEYTVAARP